MAYSKDYVLKLSPINEYGTSSKNVNLFGGKDTYFAAVKATVNQLSIWPKQSKSF